MTGKMPVLLTKRYSATALQFIIRLSPPQISPNCVILYLYKAIVKDLTQIVTGHSFSAEAGGDVGEGAVGLAF